MSTTGSILAAAQAAVSTEPPPARGSISRMTRSRHQQLPARPILDEGGLEAGIIADAGRAAAATDANSVPGALPVDHLVVAILGVAAVLGTMAIDTLAHARAALAPTMTVARGLYRPMSTWQRAIFWGCLIMLETVAVQKVLADVLGLNQDAPRWAAAACLAGVTAIAGMAVARSLHGARPATTEDPDGMIGRGLLRVAGWLAVVAVLLFAVGLVWVRVTSADEASGGLLDPTPDMTGPHTVFIAGIVALSFTVSFTLKVTELALDSRTALRLTVGLQRQRSQAMELVSATLCTVDEYLVLEARVRELAAVAPSIWTGAFLAALHPDTRDRWATHIETHPQPAAPPVAQSAWVDVVRNERTAILVRLATLAMPVQDGAHDLLSTAHSVDLRERVPDPTN